MAKTRRNLYIEDDLWQKICEQAKKESRSASWLIINYIHKGLSGQVSEQVPDENIPIKPKIAGGLKWKS